MKKTARKVLLMACSALLLVCLTVGATVAYLTAQDTVTNTFTVGNIVMMMDETNIDGNPTGVARDKDNTYNKIQPGDELPKDPIVWVKKDSEKAYVFIEITNELAGIEAETNTIAAQIEENGWKELQTNVYYKVVNAAELAASTMEGYTDYVQLDTFTTVTISGDVNSATLQTYNNKTISVKAYAIQYASFEDSAAYAYAAVKSAYQAQ